MATADPREASFGLYIHWPFCEAKCPYCDFNSHVSKRVDQTRWLSSYLSEIKRYSSEIPARTLSSVFFGGGTPSLMDPGSVAAIIEAAKSIWPVANDLEVTLEANPTSVEAARFHDFRSAGINRVSIGVQSLNDDDLKRLGRLHTASEARSAIAIGQRVFERTNFDLIYARQYQSLSDWRTELSDALNLAGDHLSLYQLTIEPNTAFGDRFDRGRLRGLVMDDDAADMYEVTQELCSAKGLDAYEVSNHARDMAQSRHNLIYWRGGDYVGVGPGAHGRITIGGTRWATETWRNPNGWLDAVANNGSGETERTCVTSTDQAVEYTMMALRLNEGLDRRHLQAIGSCDFNDGVLHHLSEIDMIQVSGDRITATNSGRRVLNSVIESLVSGLC